MRKTLAFLSATSALALTACSGAESEAEKDEMAMEAPAEADAAMESMEEAAPAEGDAAATDGDAEAASDEDLDPTGNPIGPQ